MPFKVVRKTKVSKEKAAKMYSPGKLSAMVDKLLPGGKHYGWEFSTYVVGCGDEVPSDYDPDALKYKFKVVDGYDEDQLVNDIKWLVKQGVDPKLVAEVTTGGLDLHYRDKAPPDSDKIGKITDAKKCLWVISNAPKRLKQGMTVEQYVKVYDELNKTDA